MAKVLRQLRNHVKGKVDVLSTDSIPTPETVEHYNGKSAIDKASNIKNETLHGKSDSQDFDDDGTLIQAGHLYRDNEGDGWDEWAPDDADNDLETSSRYQKYAIVVRRQKKRGVPGLPLHSIVIHSPLLRALLDRTFEDYDGISTKLGELKFYAPFHEFYYQWHRFEKLTEQEESTTTKRHLALLYPIIALEILPHIKAMEDFVANGVISFDYLWAIFPPGSNVYTKLDEQDRILSMKKAAYTKDMCGCPIFRLGCQYIDTDGKAFGYVQTSVDVSFFEGVKNIKDLETVPTQLLPEVTSLLEKLLHGGERFEQLQGVCHVAYEGMYIDSGRASGSGK